MLVCREVISNMVDMIGFKEKIATLPDVVSEEHLLSDNFLLHREEDVEIFYAPVGAANPKARVTIIGITPNWVQMRLAVIHARKALIGGATYEEACMVAKRKAAFAGAMRKKIIDLLDHLELHHKLKLSSCAELFKAHSDLLDTALLLPYPVFVRGKNYNGYKPELHYVPTYQYFLDRLVEDYLAKRNTLIIPLGRTVSNVLEQLTEFGHVERSRCLFNFPHPSCARASKERHLVQHLDELKGTIDRWFCFS